MVKKSFPIIISCALAMAGCSSLSHDQLNAYCHPDIDPAISAKIHHGGKLDLADVTALSKNGVRSSQIMTYLAYSGTEFDLTEEDAATLREDGVSGDVIAYMRDHPNRTRGLLSTF